MRSFALGISFVGFLEISTFCVLPPDTLFLRAADSSGVRAPLSRCTGAAFDTRGLSRPNACLRASRRHRGLGAGDARRDGIQ
jgi:hypothetical protein